MLVAEEAVEIRVLSKQGKSIREIARMLNGVAQHGAALSARRRAAAIRA
jgi:IS30 family transposase